MCSTTAKLNRVLLVACFYLFLIKSLLLKRKKNGHNQGGKCSDAWLWPTSVQSCKQDEAIFYRLKFPLDRPPVNAPPSLLERFFLLHNEVGMKQHKRERVHVRTQTSLEAKTNRTVREHFLSLFQHDFAVT